PALMHLLRAPYRDALPHCPVPDIAPKGRADADLDHALGVDEAFVHGMVEDRAMAVFLPKAVRPGIDMSIEMDEADRPLPPGDRAQQRQGDRMVAAERNEMPVLRRL